MIIIGLGNPGKKFELTRHNAGFFVLDKIKENYKFSEFEFNKKFNAEISQGNYKLPASPAGEKAESYKLFLAKPQTYMNLSGEAVKNILDFYKFDPENIIVIHDDIDIPLGKYKIASDSRSAGHNGVQNIIEKLGTQKFLRIRIGIGQEKEGALVCRLGVHDFVLEKFSAEELETIKKISEDILEEISVILSEA